MCVLSSHSPVFSASDPAIPYAIFSNRHELLSITLNNKGMGVKALISSLKNTIALDFFHSDEGDAIFWTDIVHDKIYKGTLLAGGKEGVEGNWSSWDGKRILLLEINKEKLEIVCVSYLGLPFNLDMLGWHICFKTHPPILYDPFLTFL